MTRDELIEKLKEMPNLEVTLGGFPRDATPSMLLQSKYGGMFYKIQGCVIEENTNKKQPEKDFICVW